MNTTRPKVLLAVLDGMGLRDEEADNAVAQADTPNLDRLFATYPFTELDASGEAVGLPEGYIGNSEVGHLHIGAGRVIPQELVRINEAIADGSFFENPALADAAAHVQETGGTVHLMGIASDGGVHGHIDHLLALMGFFAGEGCDVETHAFLDGRDVEPKSAQEYLDRIDAEAEEIGNGRLGSFMGRYFAMDRDQNWDRTRTAYDALVNGEGHRAESAAAGLTERYRHDRNDYFVEPVLLPGFEPVRAGDAVVFANWRKDRARQLTRAFIMDDFSHFETDDPDDIRFVSMMPYDDRFAVPTIMEEQEVEDTVGEALSTAGKRQLRLTESQKEPHVTYFFDGQREMPWDGMDTKVFKSANVAAYDEKPEMEADSITAYAEEVMADGTYDFILINYPNGDLVGHTGDMDAAITAVETVDAMVGRLADAAEKHGYTLILTADHGNCEEMAGRFSTSHTLNPVPFCVVDDALQDRELRAGGLGNIAASLLELLDVDAPAVMESGLFRE